MVVEINSTSQLGVESGKSKKHEMISPFHKVCKNAISEIFLNLLHCYNKENARNAMHGISKIAMIF